MPLTHDTPLVENLIRLEELYLIGLDHYLLQMSQKTINSGLRK